ncbi:hypothetical protein NDU88_001607 [Pleurodeles waltl]|uniref:Uncharacterized protein n=1 Tax=Pleurodeles waltl TaxID=8319 RepID=A0AAV7WIU6_PLEWA|nr:hypothetical protein NDU88_001607 [Pleurodeles waltl]
MSLAARRRGTPHNLERPVSLACWRSDATSAAGRGAPDRFFSSSGDDAGCQLARSSPLDSATKLVEKLDAHLLNSLETNAHA